MPPERAPAARRVEWLNLAAVLLALGASTLLALRSSSGSSGAAPRRVSGQSGLAEALPLAEGGQALRDASGALIPLGPYRRVASGSSLADPILLELCAPDEVVSFSSRAADARDAHRYAGKPSIDARRVEALLAARPDLVLVNSLGDLAWVQKLRDAGLRVFDLGPMRGLDTFARNVLAVGWLVGRLEAARQLELAFRERLAAVARHVPAGARHGGLYLGIHGNQLFGGTRGTSYHDVLTFAGLLDVAARDQQGWPSFSPEQLLAMDPQHIVTQLGMGNALCQRGELGRLRACRDPSGVIELDGRLLSDPGFGLLEASEAVHRAVYPQEQGQ
jgi:iron complex transport system substrate-binding protein